MLCETLGLNLLFILEVRICKSRIQVNRLLGGVETPGNIVSDFWPRPLGRGQSPDLFTRRSPKDEGGQVMEWKKDHQTSKGL